MLSILVYGLLLAGSVWNGISASPFDRIIGGSNAGVGQYPHQVSLQNNAGHFCGGSIIGGSWILCAGHCIGSDIMSSVVVVGITQLSAGGQAYAIYGGVVHQQFNPNTLQNDISLIQVNRNIVTSNLVRPISLASVEPPDNAMLVLSGWGYTTYPPQGTPNNLQHIALYKISLNQCAQSLPNQPVYGGNLCTFAGTGQGACNGDSGGPLIYNGVQVGVVSWGIPCARGVPDVFTSVPAFRNWIRANSGI
ncbi:hypothetical protein FQR65_LT12992 [Abscondita terminalis]|nr:hypothetical protein FQR65_LT12991 [Abscondita terminalis]KAF5285995.1 hypothetical protein FQR65_LT12992 [Abscondita terminalis]